MILQVFVDLITRNWMIVRLVAGVIANDALTRFRRRRRLGRLRSRGGLGRFRSRGGLGRLRRGARIGWSPGRAWRVRRPLCQNTGRTQA